MTLHLSIDPQPAPCETLRIGGASMIETRSTVLVTGAGGFVGGRGHRVSAAACAPRWVHGHSLHAAADAVQATDRNYA